MSERLASVDGAVNVLIQGASRGIGLGMVRALLEAERVETLVATSRNPEASDALGQLRDGQPTRLHLVAMDVTDESSVRAAARQVGEWVDELHFLFNVAGLLHDQSRGMQPEKSLRDVDPSHLHRSFAVNAVGPLLVAKHFESFFRHERRAVVANMSARVGSIGDNRRGGWYAYRATKAAQNQITRTLSIEMARRAPEAICVALHPGTVDTQLSEPFQGSVPDEQLFSVEQSVDHLLEVVDGLGQEDSGEFFDWAGEPIEW
jgi:NAD(P)-dependent dehydrogenase (short-subunit alcohol dehydrogenase family)